MRYLVRGKKWTPGQIFACEKWSAHTKTCSGWRIGNVCALALALALPIALALGLSTFGCHNWTPGPVFARSTFCVTDSLRFPLAGQRSYVELYARRRESL